MIIKEEKEALICTRQRTIIYFITLAYIINLFFFFFQRKVLITLLQSLYVVSFH